ncbi:hypothetical protein [Plantibacter sp. T3]|uniref:hypothetical protein n=1 Tax=Plantibacter sp. T3 TaxID=2653161 RepID=UPI0012F0CCB4|nr:hypothetical protein [Plantibacter sp. T3]VXB16496.1 conserved hypothetical protein [Plantibacter sp. T3]
MWISDDGRYNIVDVPAEAYPGRAYLLELVAALEPDELQALITRMQAFDDAMIDRLENLVDDEAPEVAPDPEREAPYVDEMIPRRVLDSIDWDAILTPPFRIEAIDVAGDRWRMDAWAFLESIVEPPVTRPSARNLGSSPIDPA